jgi:hypothetical protein
MVILRQSVTISLSFYREKPTGSKSFSKVTQLVEQGFKISVLSTKPITEELFRNIVKNNFLNM